MTFFKKKKKKSFAPATTTTIETIGELIGDGRPMAGSGRDPAMGHHLQRLWVMIFGDFSTKPSLKN
jgi:hypothetical protein